ncbi:virion RNA polymerase [Erwinia phage vB_EamP-S6]|uniref:Virion encapsidated RNAP n=1 Tax=Erwinia phage vB_EamP-S6 TaxID=1051675 RepID=G0YQH1_9CAUD|nr:virion RNA polymerase [Erwinia phage vB_EamP-S6]AEJ81598.1 virion encapsidated RNAP [Erwinia phage vB_EamP-S6]
MAEPNNPLVGANLNQSFADSLANLNAAQPVPQAAVGAQLFSNYAGSLVEQKKQAVQEKVAQKKVQADPNSLAAMSPMDRAAAYASASKSGDDQTLSQITGYENQEAQQRRLAEAERSGFDYTNDVASSLLRGIGNLGSGVSQLALEAVPTTLAGSALRLAGVAADGLGADGVGQSLDEAGTWLRGPTNSARAKISGWNKSLQDTALEQMSLPSRRDIAQAGAEQQLDEADSKAQAEKAGGGAWEETKRFGRDAASGLGNMVDNPLSAQDMVIQQFPQLATGGISRAAATAQLGESVGANLISKAANAAETAAIKKGATLAEAQAARATATRAMEGRAANATRDAVDDLAEKYQILNIGVQEAGGAADQAGQQVLAMKHEDLMKNSEQYRGYIDRGMSQEDAKNAVAADAGNIAAAIQMPAAMLTGKVAARFETNPFGVAGDSAKSRLLAGFQNVGREVLEEIPQSTTGQIASNIGVKATGDNTQDALEGAGNAASQGLLGALGVSSTVQAPGVIAKPLLNGSSKVLEQSRTLISDIAENRRTNNAANRAATEDATNQETAFADAVNSYDPTVGRPTNAEQTPIQEAPTQGVGDVADTQPGDISSTDTGGDAATQQVSENIFDPQGRTIVDALAQTGMNDAQQLGAVHDMIQKNPDMPAEQRRALEIFASDRVGNLIAHLEDNLVPAFEAATDPEVKKAIGGQMQAINTVVSSPRTQQFLDTYSPENVTDEEFNSVIAAMPDTITDSNINEPAVQNSFAKLKEMALYRPLDIPADQYQKVLDHDTTLTPQQRTVLQAKQVAAQQFAANNESVSGNVKTQSRQDFKSTREHAAGIFEAMAQKNPKLAFQRLTQLQKFAQGMVDRANAHSNQMRIVRGSGMNKDNRYTNVPGYFQLNADGSRGKEKPQFVQLGQKGEANIAAINSDAAHVADVYNAILRSIPNAPQSELIQPPINNWQQSATTEEVDAYEAKNGITRTPTTSNAPATGAPVQQQSDNTAPVQDDANGTPESSPETNTTEPVADSAEAVPDVEPSTYGQSALTEADARELSDDQITDLMTEAQSHISEQGYDKTAQDNFRTLSDEMTRREESVEEEVTDTEDKPVDSEKAAPVGQQVLDKVPATNEAYSEEGTPAEKSARTNQLRASFQVRSNAATGYALGYLNSVTPEAVSAALGVAGNSTMAGLKGIQSAVRSVAQAMNKRLAQADARFKMSEKYNTGFPAWAVQDRKAAYATVLGENGKVAYVPEIQEAFGLSSMHWALNAVPTALDYEQAAELLGIRSDEVTPAQLKELNDAGITLNSVAGQISSMAEKVLGIQVKKDASKTYGRNITNAIAREMLASMADAGIVTITPVPMPGRKEVVNMVRVNDTDAMTAIRENLGGDTKALESLLLPDDKTGYTIGSNELNVAQRVNGASWQQVPEMVRTSIENQQNQPYYVNQNFRGLFERLAELTGTDALTAAGYQNTSDEMNDEHRASIESKNKGLINAMNAAGNLLAALDARATDDTPANQVPIHWEYAMDTNGRTRMTAAFNPQSNKVMRELFSATNVEVSLDNPQHMREFQLHLAQGLGIKVDKMANNAAIEAVNNLLNTDLQLQAGVSAMEKGLTDGWDSLTKAEADTINAAAAGKDNKYLHTMLSAAAHNVALAEGNPTFEHAVTFEVDGVTDGPANSFVHYGMTTVNEFALGILGKVGWNVGQPDMPSNMTYDPVNNPDMYVTTASNIYGYLKSATDPMAQSLMSLLTYAGMTSQDDENKTTGLTRNFAKLLVTPATYGSGSRAMSATVVNEVVNNFYSHLTDVLAGRDQFNTGMAAALDDLTGTGMFSALANASDKQRRQFRVPEGVLKNTYAALNESVGELMYKGIDDTVGGALARNKEMAALTNIQGLMFKSAWEKAYNELQAKRVSEGTLAPNEMLSQSDEDSITKELEHLAPIYQNGVTGNDRANGFNMGTMSPNGVADYMTDGTRNKSRVTDLTGGLASNSNGTEIGSPGVRTVALATISGGDATMMTRFFNMIKKLGLVAQNVYDGLDTRVGDMEAASDAINQSVAEGWGTNLYANIIAGTSKALENLDLAAMSDADFAQVVRSVTNKFVSADKVKAMRNAKTYAALTGEIQSMLQSHKQMSARNAAVRQALLETKSTISHMGGVDKAYNHGDQVYTGTRQEQIAAMQARADAILKENLSAKAPTHDKALVEKFKQYGSEVAEGAYSLTKDQLMNALATHPMDRVTKALFTRLAPALSSNLQVYFGTPDQVTAMQQAMFPDVRFNADANASTYGNAIFLRVANNETLFHEAIHAGIQNGINQAIYSPDTASAEQVAAVNNMQVLMRQFMNLTGQNSDFATMRSLKYAQTAINRHITNGDTASALNEFVAWTLANQNLQALTSTVTADASAQVDGPLVRIMQKLKTAVLRLLGFPTTSGQSVLEALAGNFDNMVQTIARGNLNEMSMTDLNQALDHDTSLPDHVNRLDSLVQRLDAATKQTVKQTGELLAQNARSRAIINGQAPNINATLKEFQAAGWNMSPKEEHAFNLTQVLLASGLQLNPTALNAMQRLYDSVMPKLEATDFATNGDAKLNALRNNDKTTQLANFVALANTNEEFRQALAKHDIPRRNAPAGDVMARLSNGTKDLIDYIADLGNGTRKAANAAQALDILSDKIADINYATKTSVLDAPTSGMNRADSFLSAQLQRLGTAAADLRDARVSAGAQSGVDTAVNTLLSAVGALDKNSGSQDALQNAVNSSKLWRPVQELFTEMLGTSKSSVMVNKMLQQAKNQVSAVRQKIREGVPKNIQSKFTRELTKAEWAAVTRAFGKTDVQSLLQDYSMDDVQTWLKDPKALQKAVQAEERNVAGMTHGADYVVRSKELAHFMMTGDNISDHLLRNATAIAELTGTGKTVTNAEQNVSAIDNLVSLYALQMLSEGERTTMGSLFDTERSGLDFVGNYMTALNSTELRKMQGYDSLNGYKGHLPSVTSHHMNMVVADAKTGASLVKNYGYVKVDGYVGDADLGKNALSYYFTNENLQAGYTQGAMQTVEPLVYGVDPITGQSTDLRGSFSLRKNAATAMARQKNSRIVTPKLGTTGGKLMPVFNKNGEVTGYEAPMPDAIRQERLGANTNLSELLGVWQGRQTEETLAQGFNDVLAQKLASVWDSEKGTIRKEEYIDLAKSAETNKADAETWNAIPRAMQESLKSAFKGKPVMVRRDMLNNAFGYRNFSVTSAFTNQTDLPKPVTDGLVDLATAIMGAKAARYLRKGERYTQDAVSMAKDWVIVRSVSVFTMNLMGNFIQLGQNGVGLKAIFKGQAAKMQEVDAYLRNVNKQNQLYSDNLGTTDAATIARNKRHIQRLAEANKRMSIAPLIAAGELPTVAEGLTIEDDNAIRGGALNWIERITDKVPKGVSDTVKLAMIAKGTPLHNGLNRMMTYGDFVAKAVLFDKLTKQDGKSAEEALRYIQEEFINYDNNPGRTRTYLESMGFTWFLTYKLKIQKILLRRMRDNPLSTLVYQGAADGLGIDSPFEANLAGDNFWYSIDTPLRALDAPTLHPVAQMLR